MKTAALLVDRSGKRLTTPVLRAQFDKARDAVAAMDPTLAGAFEDFRFYNLQAKAADNIADGRG